MRPLRHKLHRMTQWILKNPCLGLSKDLLHTLPSICQDVLGKELLHCSSPNKVLWSKHQGAEHGAYLVPDLSFPLSHRGQTMHPQRFSNTALRKWEVQLKQHQTTTVSPEKQVISCTRQMKSGFPQITCSCVMLFLQL